MKKKHLEDLSRSEYELIYTCWLEQALKCELRDEIRQLRAALKPFTSILPGFLAKKSDVKRARRALRLKDVD